MTERVRSAVPSDAAAVLALICQHATFERDAASLSVGDLGTILSSGEPPARIFVAEDDAMLLGYAAMTFDFSLWRARRYAYLDCLFVTEGARGRGIGKKLFDAAVDLALAEGADRLEWQTPAWNSAAVHFYLRLGAAQATKERFALSLW